MLTCGRGVVTVLSRDHIELASYPTRTLPYLSMSSQVSRLLSCWQPILAHVVVSSSTNTPIQIRKALMSSRNRSCSSSSLVIRFERWLLKLPHWLFFLAFRCFSYIPPCGQTQGYRNSRAGGAPHVYPSRTDFQYLCLPSHDG